LDPDPLAVALIRAVPCAVVAADRRGEIRFANLEAGRLFGCQPSQLVGRPLDGFIPGQGREAHTGSLLTYFASGGRPMDGVQRAVARRFDGTDFPAEVSLGPVITDEGLLVAAVIREVSDGVAAAAAEERVRAAAERQHLGRRALRAQRLTILGELAGSVAHDVTNWLEVILSYTGLASKHLASASAGSQTESVGDDLAQIQRAAQGAARLTRELLAFHRPEASKTEPVDLNQVIRDLEQLIRISVGERVSLATSLDPGLWLIHTDIGQIEQVLINLVVNARDAMPHGGTLTIATENLTIDEANVLTWPGLHRGPHVRLRVTDNGIGMSSEVREHAFEPFFTTKPHGRGSGLGLATVAAIVFGWGGQTRIDSAPGQGATCTAVIPVTGGGASRSGQGT
jgi:hypothetical protein